MKLESEPEPEPAPEPEPKPEPEPAPEPELDLQPELEQKKGKLPKHTEKSIFKRFFSKEKKVSLEKGVRKNKYFVFQ